MPVKLPRFRQLSAPAKKKLASLGATARDEARLQRLSTRNDRLQYLMLDVTYLARHWPRPAEALGEAVAKLPIPKVMSYQLADGWARSSTFCMPAHGLVALHASRSCRLSVLACSPAARRAATASKPPCPSSRCAARDSYAEQLKSECAVIAGSPSGVPRSNVSLRPGCEQGLKADRRTLTRCSTK